MKLIRHFSIFLAILLGGCLVGCGHQSVLRTVPITVGEKKSDHYAEGIEYMITTQGSHSTKAGKLMYQLGGNAVDAATAISFALSVERPQSTGIGGGGFMLIQSPHNKIPEAWDFREKAPFKGHTKMFLDEKGEVVKDKSLVGIHSVGVPSLVAGILEIHAKYGKLPLTKVLAPAITLADGGFSIYPELAKALKLKEETLRKFPASAKIFFKNRRVLKEGERFIQKDLAQTLRAIARRGRKGFYEGPVSQAIVRESTRHSGLLTQKDLDAYNVKIRPPIQGSYKGRKIFSMSPPSSGGIHIVQILNIAEKFRLKHYGPQHPQSVHLLASAMQQAFVDRARYLGDTDFVKVPVAQLISKEYAAKVARRIPQDRARGKANVRPGEWNDSESDQTTHFSLMDSDGWAISSTQTLNGYFGSGLVVEGTGIILNNQMDDFTTKVGASNLFGAVGGENNLVAPEKRPLSSMSPTIVIEKGKPLMALGSPSGTRILTCVAQTLLNYFEYGLSLRDSVSAVRYHHQ